MAHIPLDRRSFLGLSGAGSAALIFSAGPYVDQATAAVCLPDQPFKLGVASGDPPPERTFGRTTAWCRP